MCVSSDLYLKVSFHAHFLSILFIFDFLYGKLETVMQRSFLH